MSRIIEFEGRRIQVPPDATDAEIAEILGGQPAAQAAPEGVPSPAGQPPMPPPAAPLTPEQQLNQLSFGSPNLDPAPAPSPKRNPHEVFRQGLKLPGPDHRNAIETAFEGAPKSRGVQIAGQVLGNTVGLPADLANFAVNAPGMAINAFGGDVPPIRIPGGSEDVRALASQAAEHLGFPVEDFSKLPGPQKTAANALVGAGSGVTGAGLIRGLAAVMPGSGVMQRLAEPYTTAQKMGQPVRPYLGDAAAGAGAETTVAAMDQGGVESPIAKLFGSLAGGVGGTTALRAATQFDTIPRAIHGYLAKDPTTGATIRQSNMARGMAQELAVDPQKAAQNIETEQAFFRQAGTPEGATPLAGDMSNDPGLIAAQRADAMRRTDPRLGDGGMQPADFAERNRVIKTQAAQDIRDVNPDGDAYAPERFVKAQNAQTLDAAQQPVRQAESGLTAAQQAEADFAARTQQNEALRTPASREIAGRVDAVRQADETKKVGLYREAENLGKATPVDTTPIAAAAKAVRDEISPLAGQDQRLNNVLDDIGRFTGEDPRPMTVKDMVSALPRLSSARDAATRLNRGDTVQNLDTISKSIREELTRMAGAGDEAAVAWRNAEGNFKTDYAPKWREGVGAEIRKADRDGQPIQPENVADKFLAADTKSAYGKRAAEDYERILGESGKAPARDFLIGDMAKSVVRGGKIDPGALERWIKLREGIWQKHPDVKREAEGVLADVRNKRANVSAMTAELKRAQAGLKQTEAEISKSALTNIIDKDPAKAVAGVFGGDDPLRDMQKIMTEVRKDPEALKGWRTAVGDYLENTVLRGNPANTTVDKNSPLFSELNKLFNQHEKVFAEVYRDQPDAMNLLRRAHRAVMNVERQGVRSTPGSPTAEYMIQEKDLRPVEIMAKLYFGQLKGGGIMRSLKLALPNMPGYNDAEKAGLVIRRMWGNPELAKHLLTTPAPGPSAARWNRKLNTLMGLQEAGKESSDEDPKKD